LLCAFASERSLLGTAAGVGQLDLGVIERVGCTISTLLRGAQLPFCALAGPPRSIRGFAHRFDAGIPLAPQLSPSGRR
jgi:hypothetical protein